MGLEQIMPNLLKPLKLPTLPKKYRKKFDLCIECGKNYAGADNLCYFCRMKDLNKKNQTIIFSKTGGNYHDD